MAAQTCSEHCPGLWGSPPTTQLRGGGASIPPLSLLIPEAHSTLRFPRSRVAVRCLRTSVSWGLGPRGLAPCRRGCSFRYCSSFDSPRRSSAMSSAKNKGRSYTGRGMVSVLGTPLPTGPQNHPALAPCPSKALMELDNLRRGASRHRLIVNSIHS